MTPSVHRPVLAIGLDGFEISLAETLMAAGEMPSLAALRDRSAQFLLDHGSDQKVGLAWEHVATGLTAKDASRWSAIEFDPATYFSYQKGAALQPVLGTLPVRSVVLDAPYFDLTQAEHIEGLVGWSGLDSGMPLISHPPSLYTELTDRFGPYPATDWVYACPAYSVEACERMGVALVEAVELRRRIALWMWSKHSQACDLFHVVAGEVHAAIEGLWHGIDPSHPMHEHESAPAAAESLRNVYKACDRLVGDLLEVADGSSAVVFAPGGMGINDSDLQSMVLLPELLCRHAFGRPFLEVPTKWSQNPGDVPQLKPDQTWGQAKSEWYPNNLHTLPSRLARRIHKITGVQWPGAVASNRKSNLNWHPAMAYQAFWPRMPAFALPSHFDGRVRLNLAGRESRGIVALEDYEDTCNAIVSMVAECRDPRTGECVVARVERSEVTDPLQLHSSDADIRISWQGCSNGFEHPEHGLIGPVPYRRTGGHTGPYGVAFVAAEGVGPGRYGVRPTVDLVPSLVEMLGVRLEGSVSGASFLEPCQTSA